MNNCRRIGLLVRSAPWSGLSGRDQLDPALAAAALGIELDLYFIGAGVMHLLGDRAPGAAGLPATHRAWRALADMTTVRAWAESGRLPEGAVIEPGLLPELRIVSASKMPALQAACDRLWVL